MNEGQHTLQIESKSCLVNLDLEVKHLGLEGAYRRQAVAEEAARRQAEAEEAARRQAEAEEAARRQAEAEEAARRQAEEAARRQAEAEEAATRRQWQWLDWLDKNVPTEKLTEAQLYRIFGLKSSAT